MRGPVQHVSQDRAGILWLATVTGLHRLDPATGEFRHYAHDPTDPDSLTSSEVTATYEDPHGTLWVLTLAGLDAFDRRTGEAADRIRFSLPDGRGFDNALGIGGCTLDHLRDRQWTGRLGPPYTTADAVFIQGPRAARLAAQRGGGIHEDADGNLWLATYGSGLVRIDPNRRSAVQYRHSPLRPDGISDVMLGAVFEDREGNIWVGPGPGRLNRFRRKPLPFTRYPYEADNPQSLLIPAISSVYVDSQDNIWVGHVAGVTRIDGKSGNYSFFRTAGSAPANLSNTFVTAIVEDHSGYLWFGTYRGRSTR